MAGNFNERLASARVPQQDFVVAAGGEQHVFGGGMPYDGCAAALMSAQLDQRLGDVAP